MSAPERVHDGEQEHNRTKYQDDAKHRSADEQNIADRDCVAHSRLSTMSLPRLMTTRAWPLEIREAISARVSLLMICPCDLNGTTRRGLTNRWGAFG